MQWQRAHTLDFDPITTALNQARDAFEKDGVARYIFENKNGVKVQTSSPSHSQGRYYHLSAKGHLTVTHRNYATPPAEATTEDAA